MLQMTGAAVITENMALNGGGVGYATSDFTIDSRGNSSISNNVGGVRATLRMILCVANHDLSL